MALTNEIKRVSGYHAWYSLKNRVSNSKCKNYKDYGGRGITICQGINKSFEHFIRVIGVKPSVEMTIDRKDNNLGYWCGDCDECLEKGQKINLRWTTRTIQSRNRRVRSTNKSGFSGVIYNNRNHKWQSTISVNKNRIHLGWFDDKQLAIYTRKQAEIRYWGITS